MNFSLFLHLLEYYSIREPQAVWLLALMAASGGLAVVSLVMILRKIKTHYDYQKKVPTQNKLLAPLEAGGGLAFAPLALLFKKSPPRHYERQDRATKNPNRSSVSEFAYGNPWLLRTSEHTVWYGLLILGSGLVLTLFMARRIDPRVKTWALQQEMVLDKDPRLADMQSKWRDLFSSKEWSGDAVKLPLNESPALLAATSAYWQKQNRIWEIAGIGLFLAGVFGAIRSCTREKLGPEDFGQAAFATRNDVVFDETGSWILPLKVDQHGSRSFEAVVDGPFTVAKPGLTTLAVHIVGIGNAGSGKGAYLAGHIFKTDPNPIIYFDYKGEMPAYPLRPGMLRWGFPSQRPKGLPSLRLNLVDWVKGHEDPDTAAKILASAILPQNSKKESDNGWIKDTAIPILAQGFLMNRWANLAELADEVEHTPLLELLENIEVGRGRAQAFQGRNVPEYAQNEISNQTAAYLSGRARHIVSASDFTLEEAFEKGLYIMGQAASPYERRVLTMLWNVFWAELLRKSDPMPMTVLVDEGVANGPVPRVEEALVTLRDRSISLIQFFQTRAGLVSVYGRDLADSVWDAHQTHIFLTKGLSKNDIKNVCEIAGTYTHPGKRKEDKPTKAELLPFDKFQAHCRQEKYWAFIDGVQWTRTGLPIFAELQPIPRSGWNWRASTEEYDAELARLEYGSEWQSPYKMVLAGTVEKDQEIKGKVKTHRFRHWVPAYPEAAAKMGVTEKHVLIDEAADLYRQLSLAEAEKEPDPVAAAYKAPEHEAEEEVYI